jgi:PAS domain S-box-containing protein
LKSHDTSTPADLRRIAEAKMTLERASRPPQSHADIQRLQHELEVHQIELELQNQELRAAQNANAAALERYTDLFDFAPVGYFNLGSDGSVSLVNLTGAKLVGVDRAQLLGRRLGLLVSPFDRKDFSDFIDRVFATEIKQTCEVSLAAEDRPSVIVQLEAVVTSDKNECRVAMVDITARKQAERTLHDNATFTADVLNSLNDHVVVLDEHGTIIAVNEAWRRFAQENGAHDKDFVGVSYLKVCHESVLRCHPVGAAQTEAGIRAILDGGQQGFTLEYPCDAPSETRWFRLRLAPLSGGRHGVVVSHHDISELKKAVNEAKQSLEALRLSERRFKALFDQAAMGVALTDVSSHRFAQVNRHYCEITGYTQAELETLTFADITHPEDAVYELKMADKLLTGVLREYTREKRYVRKDHTEIWVCLTVSAMWMPDETPDYFVVIVQDITGRKLLEEQVRQAQKMEAIGTLAGGIAHDFNNILAAITGYTELSLLTLNENPKVRENLASVLKATIRATGLVKQILAFSRQQATTRVVLSLGPIVAECIVLLRATIPSSIELDTSLAPDAPCVLVDATHIHQILMNLGTNAWHAMKDRPGKLEVRLERVIVDGARAARQSRLHPGVYARISVRDTGCGMNQATLLRIFEPFFTTKPIGEGTGLGLAVVHGIMDNHDGAVTVQSTLGKGTEFQLYFPEKTGCATPVEITAEKAPRGHGERILIVDDESTLVQLSRMTLTALGYQTDITTKPDEALDWVRTNPQRFDLVLTDQTMPGMTGLVFAAQLQLLRPGLPIILTTGYMAALTAEQIKTSGISKIIHKPATLHEIAVALQSVLSAVKYRLWP